ncbi:type II secretion system minor pseudopilin GspK [Emcibacter nanhaiensis]|uniref:Type II secretion system protein K n=1 Tax=Emcibacter nanhaiensis TaxID=1505037 RepID=A0A501PS83_9PROT|nr:type II secretion system minor pseudopilin GspK [Emcibacter nanhaiensis]TPD62646.1 general secretion pathway protein GspK [Emcibacter nanhaiensis]
MIWRQKVTYDRESGAALLTVLLLVAIISALVVGMLDQLRFNVRRAGTLEKQQQAEWYAVGLEEYAGGMMKSLHKLSADKTTRRQLDRVAAFSVPIEDGVIRGQVTDGGNCFNLNSVVERRDGNRYLMRESGREQYVTLLKTLGIPGGDAVILANRLVDWVDSDSAPMTWGAEDYHYMGLQNPYRTANTLLANVSELRQIEGYTPEVLYLIRDYVCTLPTPELSPININTLKREQAPLLVMLLGEKLLLQKAEQVIDNRPDGGYDSPQAFWADRLLADTPPTVDVQDQVVLATRYFELTADVSWQDRYLAMTSLLELENTGDVRLVSRQFGEKL